MSLSILEIESAILGLPAPERAKLAELLIHSLHEGAPADELSDEEIERRAEDLRTGRVEGIPCEEVIASMHDLIASGDDTAGLTD
jgi:putative addiction module component (TIGR02574 family)